MPVVSRLSSNSGGASESAIFVTYLTQETDKRNEMRPLSNSVKKISWKTRATVPLKDRAKDLTYLSRTRLLRLPSMRIQGRILTRTSSMLPQSIFSADSETPSDSFGSVYRVIINLNYVFTSDVVCIGFNADQVHYFWSMRIRMRIQDSNAQKLKKIYSWN